MWLWCFVVSLCWFAGVTCLELETLGIESGLLPETAFKASSHLEDYGRPQLARLNNVKREEDKGGWIAKTNDGHQWIKVDLGERKVVREVLTQGRQDAQEWVKSFTVGYGDTKDKYRMYRDKYDFVKEFPGNRNNIGIVKNTFNPPITARFITIFPCKWHGRISMRLDFTGKPVSKPKHKRCPSSFELGFLIPDTRQAEKYRYALKTFVKSVCDLFQLSKEMAHFGLVTYSKRPSVRIRFSSFLTNSDARSRVDGICFSGGAGNRANAGLKAVHSLFREKGVEHTRRTLLVVVSGLQGKKQATKMIDKIHMMGEEEIKPYVIVIGPLVNGVKEALGYDNGGARIFYFPSFERLLHHGADIAQLVCKGDESTGGEDHH